MKKTLLTIIPLVVAASAMAQGTINFANSVSGVFRNPIYDVNPASPSVSQSGQSSLGLPTGSTVYGGPLLQGTGYTFALYAGVAGLSDPNQLTLITTVTFRTATSATALPAGLIQTVVDVPIPGVAAGSIATLQVRAWANNGGSATFDTAVTKATSALFQSGPLGGTSPGGPVLTPDMAGWSSFSLATIPEPSTFALAGMGAAALMIFRRRKQ